jgi:hypothetical protein
MKLKKKKRKMKNLFESKYYPTIMYLSLITVSLLIVFSIVNTLDNINNFKVKEIKAITGNIVQEEDYKNAQEQSTYEQLNNSYENYETSEYIKPELYQYKSNFIFYLIVTCIIAVIFIVAIILRSTIIENIKIEHANKFSKE